MRNVLIFALVPILTMAAQARPYVNERYGYQFDIPELFSQWADEPDAQDGATFQTADGLARLWVFGGFVVVDGFAAEVKQRRSFAEEDGWHITYATASGDVISGTRDGLIFYQHIASRCNGEGYTVFRLEYPVTDKAKYDAAIAQLNTTQANNTDCTSL